MLNYPKLCCKMILLVKNFSFRLIFLMLLLNTITYRFKHDCTTTVVVAYFTHHLCMINFLMMNWRELFPYTWTHPLDSPIWFHCLLPFVFMVEYRQKYIFYPYTNAHKSISRSAEKKKNFLEFLVQLFFIIIIFALGWVLSGNIRKRMEFLLDYQIVGKIFM